ncbi:MAG: flagellar basal body-associated FliL family protein [Mesorhizobium sp.]
MAAPAATTDNAPAGKTGPSLVVQIAVLLVLSGVAAGAGLFTGRLLDPGPAAPAASAHAEAAGAHGETNSVGKDDPMANPAEGERKRGIVRLAPIMTNLAAPADTWIRLELSAVFEGEPDMPLADAIQQDVIAFIRTMKLHQIEGASGLRHLKEDIDERAAMRSGGKVRHLLVRTILIE